MRSMCFLRLSKYASCIADTEIMIRLKPGVPHGYHRKGLCHFRRGEYARAYQTYQDGLAIYPPFPPLVRGQQETMDVLRSGLHTLPSPTALLFTGYVSDITLSRSSVPRVHLDAQGTVDPETEYAAYAADVRTMTRSLKDRRIPIHASHAGPVGAGSLTELTAELRAFFDSDPVHSHYILYYSGRSNASSGDWCIAADPLSLYHVLQAWALSAACAADSRLVIISDCSFSGAWVDLLLNPPDSWSDEIKALHNVAIQASTAPTQAAGATSASGGEFTQTWLGQMSLDVDRSVFNVGTTPTPQAGLDLVKTGLFGPSDIVRPVILISSWLPQLKSLMALVQTPMAYAQWALPDEVVIHTGRRFHLLNVASARHIASLHELDLDLEVDDPSVQDFGAPSSSSSSSSSTPDCRVS